MSHSARIPIKVYIRCDLMKSFITNGANIRTLTNINLYIPYHFRCFDLNFVSSHTNTNTLSARITVYYIISRVEQIFSTLTMATKHAYVYGAKPSARSRKLFKFFFIALYTQRRMASEILKKTTNKRTRQIFE